MKIFVTGVNGYIGLKIAQGILGKGFGIIGIDIKGINSNSLCDNPSFEFFEADITNTKSFPDQLKEADILVHCAALVHKKSRDLTRENYFRVNCEGTKNVLNFLDKDRLKQIIFLSTISFYGSITNGIVPDENTPAAPEDFYGESKLAAENAVREFSNKYNIPYTIFRLTPVYGDFFLLNINKRIYLPRNIAFYKIGSGNQRLSLVSVNNVADVVAESINNNSFFNQTFIVKDIEDYSINETISTFRNKFSQHTKPVIQIPLCISDAVLKLLRFIVPERAKFYRYQLKKIADNAVFSGTKLHSMAQLKWNMKNSLKCSVKL
jgi:nucleoside-diphosphate-sugar epimerase